MGTLRPYVNDYTIALGKLCVIWRHYTVKMLYYVILYIYSIPLCGAVCLNRSVVSLCERKLCHQMPYRQQFSNEVIGVYTDLIEASVQIAEEYVLLCPQTTGIVEEF